MVAAAAVTRREWLMAAGWCCCCSSHYRSYDRSRREERNHCNIRQELSQQMISSFTTTHYISEWELARARSNEGSRMRTPLEFASSCHIGTYRPKNPIARGDVQRPKQARDHTLGCSWHAWPAVDAKWCDQMRPSLNTVTVWVWLPQERKWETRTRRIGMKEMRCAGNTNTLASILQLPAWSISSSTK